MYLSEIEIVGFKSFAHKTKLKFAQGLSAVVGPNGCGKTNVVDAIRWVLGEKKASTLRSDVMENVIFNGTRDRKPLSLAEVSITFDNSKRVLSSDYNEVVITRRLFRNGESEYLMNKTHCRLKDILDLFMDTGIGADSYSVIELKMVDAILSGKVDDRRAMFEEAAGIKKYKARRKESLKKLDAVKQDMERIQDILQEVRKNVNALSRQAAKTRRYNQYLTELRTLEIDLYAREFRHFNVIKGNLDLTKKELSAKIISYEISLTEQEKHIAQKKEILATLDSELQIASDKEKKLITKISELKQFLAVGSEKIVSFDRNKQRVINEIGESEKSLSVRQVDLQNISKDIEIRMSELNQAKSGLVALSNNRDEAQSKVNEASNLANALNNEIITLKNRIESINNLINRSKDKKIGIERKIQQLAEEKFKYEKQAEDLLTDKKSNDKELPGLRGELAESEQNLKMAFEKKISLESEIDKIKQKITDKKNIIGGKKASLDFLNSLLDSSEAAKFLSNDNNWQTGSEKVLLGETIGTDDEFRLAVLSALGESAHSFVTDSFEIALDGINSLKSKSKGKSGFICMDRIPNINAPELAPDLNGVVGWFSEIVRVDDKIRNLLRGLSGKTLIVRDSKTANDIIEKGLADVCVTTDGFLINSNGYVFGGSVSQKEGQWVGKKERILKLNNEINELNKDIEQAEFSLKELSEELNLVDISSLQHKIKIYEQNIQENQRKAIQFDVKLESITNNINFVSDNSLRLQDELQEMQTDDHNLELEVVNISDQLNGKYSGQKELLSSLDKNKTELNEKQEIYRNAELTVVSIESHLRSMSNDKSRISAEINALELKVKSKYSECDDFDNQKDEIENKLESDNELLRNAEIDLTDTKMTLQKILSDKKMSNEEFEQSNSEFNIIRKDFDKVKENYHQIEVQLAEVNSNLQNILERALEQYETDIESTEIDENPEFDIKAAKNVIHDIKDKLAQLGNVNFMALEEYEVQNERLEFYDKQMTDLTDAEKNLKETIDEINATAERNFRETFESIRANFKTLFVKLFGPDGESDIHLESDDLLESDIVITARPPNKRPHSIEMLSGGEKTLTAIALLFAIYLVKPSPFCILDEVDAPLDDANIDKFVALIKDFSTDTQFLIVTHNKKTMEAADTLYGVTMQEVGVSKVVAVKLDNDAA